MADNYHGLTRAEQAELLQGLAPAVGRRAEILEKDIWLCQVLGVLFALHCRKPMAFKGGTSLSKVYGAIERFSEDIDITVDYRSLVPDAADLQRLSRTQRDKLSETLKTALAAHVTDELMPALSAALAAALPGLDIRLEVSADGEKLWVYYPSAVADAADYIAPSILIEFGGRNSTLPQNIVRIAPDIASHVTGVTLPSADVTVLSPARTFWEKATLIHVECHRRELRAGAERLSRHWYDLAKLADHDIGRQAMQDVELLRDVVRIKQTFFRSAYSNYDRCLSGGLLLVPATALLAALREDYEAMIVAGMFFGEALPFNDILARLRDLEHAINSLSA